MATEEIKVRDIEALEITFNLTADDCWLYTRIVYGRMPREDWIWYWLRVAMWPVLLFVSLYALEVEMVKTLWVTSILGAAWSIYCVASLKRRATDSVRRRPDMLKSHVLRIDPDEIRLKGPIYETILPWRNVTDVRQNDRAILLYYSPYQAVFVQKRAFDTLEDEMTFWEAADRFWRRAKSNKSKLKTSGNGDSDA